MVHQSAMYLLGALVKSVISLGNRIAFISMHWNLRGMQLLLYETSP